jgi:hypothetical protein
MSGCANEIDMKRMKLAVLALSVAALGAHAKESAYSNDACYLVRTRSSQYVPANAVRVCVDQVSMQLDLRKGKGLVVVTGSPQVAGAHDYRVEKIEGSNDRVRVVSEIMLVQESDGCETTEETSLELSFELSDGDTVGSLPQLKGSYAKSSGICESDLSYRTLSYDRIAR